MKGKFEDLTGKVFGYLLVLEYAGKNKWGNVLWRCRCLRCGNECVVRGSSLKNGTTQSCGCLRREKLLEGSLKAHLKHGMSHSKIHNIWLYMKKRCENPNDIGFDLYGGRGIRVCERWHIFENFYADVSILPHFNEKGYTLDRIRVNEDYEPGNVRWATAKEQSRNRRSNVVVEYNGERMCLIEAAEKSGVPYKTLHRRYKHGDRGDHLFRPVKSRQCK